MRIQVFLGSVVPFVGVCSMIAGFIAGANCESDPCWLPAILVVVGFIFLLVSIPFEGAADEAMWDSRRKRWLAGGHDPAYPDSDAERKRINDRERPA